MSLEVHDVFSQAIPGAFGPDFLRRLIASTKGPIMKPEDQRIAIAKYCGWTNIRHNPKTNVWYGTPPKNHKPQWDVVIPDYYDSLNAIREAVMTLNSPENDAKGLASTFCELLENIHERDADCWIECVVSSAAQLAEAFLKTLDLWEKQPQTEQER